MDWAVKPSSDHASALYVAGAILHGSVAGLAEWTVGMCRGRIDRGHVLRTFPNRIGLSSYGRDFTTATNGPRRAEILLMSTVSYPHISLDDEGTARIAQTRYKVLHLATEHYHHGWSAEELLRQHTDLRPEEVYAALTYFYDHHDEFVSQMHEQARVADMYRPPTSLSRDALLRRRKEAS